MAAEQRGFSKESGWVILSDVEARIKEKIERIGTPLKNWNIQINYGIKTGYNEAFIIDSAKREELLKNCPKADEIIRPLLLGKNIKRYQFEWENKWILFTRRGIDIDRYPEIKQHLSTYYEDLAPRNNGELRGRKPGAYKWYEIQDNVAYFEEFEKPKIAWGNLALKPQFAFIPAGYYINAPSPFIATDDLFLLALLNSKVSDFYIKHLGVSRSGGYIEYKPMFVEHFPIPEVSIEIRNVLIEMVNQLLKTGNLIEREQIERNIEQKVSELYGLSQEEINHMN